MRKKILLTLTNEQYDAFMRLKERMLASGNADCFRMMLRDATKREFKDYIEVQRNRVRKTPEQKAAEKLEIETTKEKLKAENEYNRGKMICEALGGTEKAMGVSGTPHCEYYIYQLRGNGENEWVQHMRMVEPFNMLSDETVRDQFRDQLNKPSEEAKTRIKALQTKQK